MYAHRVAGQPGSRLPSLAAAIGINGAVLAALIYAAPEMLPQIDTPFTVRNIPLPVESPPEPPKPKPLPRTDQAAPRPRAPDTIVPVTRPVDQVEVDRVDTQVDVDPGTTTVDSGVRTDPVIVPAPVLTDAAPDPRYLRDLQPSYPPSERRLGNGGRVSVRVLVGTDGRVRQVERLSASSEAFFEATRRQALSRWRFRPATRDGVAVEAWRTMSISFVLQD